MNEQNVAETLVDSFDDQERKLSLAESCTGGLISAEITTVSGASSVLQEGIVCYSNRSKIRRLGVDPETIEEVGSVSEEVAVEMVKGSFLLPEITDALSVTGIAGPSGGTEEKPVGTVWFAMKSHEEPVITAHREFDGDRSAVRRKSTSFALQLLQDPDCGVPLHER
jgi:nicotinamide-nucleotide amidase